MTTTLLTGYEPFDDYETNPSETIANRLDGEQIAGSDVVGDVFPVEFEHTNELLCDRIDELGPDIVISLGLAPERAAINIERIGINVNSSTGVPDNIGVEPENEPIEADGSDAHFATIPVTKIVKDLADVDIPSRISNTAGTHLCNNALYSVREYAIQNDLELDSGFIHLPFSPALAIESADAYVSAGTVPPSMPLDLQTEAVRRSIAAVAEDR